jgi:hypothetical protein
MNERIVKLFMQSVDTNYIPLPIEDHIPSWTEKFAELIVRECASMAESFHRHQYDFTGNLELHEFIKEHFGVG